MNGDGDEIHEELLARPLFLQLFSHVRPRYGGWLLRCIAEDVAGVANASDDDGYENHDAQHDIHPGDDGLDDDYGQHDRHYGFVDDHEGNYLRMTPSQTEYVGYVSFVHPHLSHWGRCHIVVRRAASEPHGLGH